VNIFLAVLEAYDPTAGATTTLYFASKGFVTGPSDTPANTFFDGRILQPATMRRDMFASGTTMGRSRGSIGDMSLANPDGALDYLLDYGFDGRRIWLYYGDESGTFPTDFDVLLVGTMEQLEVGRDTVTAKLRDRQAEVDVPLQTTLYAGDNALPDGLEGVATDLLGKPKPVCYGVVKNIAPPCVNTSKLIYQVADAAVASVDGVYDSGLALHLNPNDLEACASEPFTAGINVLLYDDDGFFIATGMVSGTATVCNSPDGDTFTTRDNTTFSDPRGGAVGGGVIVLCGTSGEIGISTDHGANWSLQTSGFGTDTIASVAYGNGYFVAVGGSSSGDTSKSNAAATSWSLTSSAATAALTRVTFGNGIFLAINTTEILTSTDGATWSAGTKPTTGNMFTIGYGAGSFVLVSVSGEIFTSTDGVYWTERYSPITSQMASIDYVDGVGWVGVWSNYVVTSRDLAAWVLERPGVVAWNLAQHVAWSPSTLIVVDSASETIFKTKGVVEYASESDLLDDSLAPIPGSVKAYSPSGLVRLGSTPAGLITADVTQGATASDRTAAQVFEAVLGRAGMGNPTNLVSTDDLTAWTKVGTPTVTGGVDDPWGGTSAYTVEDDSGAAQEYIVRTVPFTGSDGPRIVAWVVRDNTMPGAGYQRLNLRDTTAAATRLTLDITGWVAGAPTIQETTGTLLVREYVSNGYWLIVGLSTDVTVANQNQVHFQPANTAAQTGKLDCYVARAWDADSLDDFDWSWLDVLRLDADNAAVLGYWSGIQQTKVADTLDRVAGSVGAWWGVDRRGHFRIARLDNPRGDLPRYSFIASDMVKPLTRLPVQDDGRGLPIYRATVRHTHYWTTQDQALAGAVSDARRASLGKEWREQTATDSTVQTAHPLAPVLTVETLLTTASDASTEATRLLALRSTRKDRYEFQAALTDETLPLDLGQVVGVTHARYGLAGGGRFAVISVEPNGSDRTITYGLWGGAVTERVRVGGSSTTVATLGTV
jgi:hypothetical protein